MSPRNYEVSEVYDGLREQVLHVSAKAIGRTDADPSTVLAVLMETGYDNAAVTLAAVADGTTSIYFSNGGGIIGAGGHDCVRKVSFEFIALVQQSLAQFGLAESFPVPPPGIVRFHVVTGGAVHALQAPEDDLGYKRHPGWPLFHKGHELIAAIRENTPDS